MAKDDRYKVAKNLILDGSVKTIRDLLTIVDKTPLARDIRTSPARLNKLIGNPALFMFGDCYAIAAVIGVDEKLIVDLVYAERKVKKRKG